MFFATLYEPAVVNALQQLLVQFKALRPVAEFHEHVDFSSLRQRILICLTTSNAIDKFLSRYSKMHAAWTQSRARMFTVRSQTGGEADNSYTCPLCCVDKTRLIGEDRQRPPLTPVPLPVGATPEQPVPTNVITSNNPFKTNSQKNKIRLSRNSNLPPQEVNNERLLSQSLPSLYEKHRQDVVETVKKFSW